MSSTVTAPSPRSRASSRVAAMSAWRVRALLSSRRPVVSDMSVSVRPYLHTVQVCTQCSDGSHSVTASHRVPLRSIGEKQAMDQVRGQRALRVLVLSLPEALADENPDRSGSHMLTLVTD